MRLTAGSTLLGFILLAQPAAGDVAYVQSATFHPHEVARVQSQAESFAAKGLHTGHDAWLRSVTTLYMGRKVRWAGRLDRTLDRMAKARRADRYSKQYWMVDDDGELTAGGRAPTRLRYSMWEVLQARTRHERGLQVFHFDGRLRQHGVLWVVDRREEMKVAWVEVQPGLSGWQEYSDAESFDQAVVDAVLGWWRAQRRAGKSDYVRLELRRLLPDPEVAEPTSAAVWHRRGQVALRSHPALEAPAVAHAEWGDVFYVAEVRGKWIRLANPRRVLWAYRNDFELQHQDLPEEIRERRGMRGRIDDASRPVEHRHRR